jgi:hypothetical protein
MLCLVKAFPDSRLYESNAWLSGIRRRPRSIAISLFRVSYSDFRKFQGHLVPSSTRSAHQIEQLPRFLLR